MQSTWLDPRRKLSESPLDRQGGIHRTVTLVWNRLRYVKDPDTGKRVSRPNPECEWVLQENKKRR